MNDETRILSGLRRGSLLLVGAMLVAGCSVPSEEPEVVTQEEAVLASTPAPTLTVEQVALEDQIRETMVVPETIVVTPELDDMSRFGLAAPDVLDRVTWPDVFSSPVPVLIPTSFAGIEDAVWLNGEHWFSVSLSVVDGVSVYVTGTRAAMVRPALRAELEAQGYDPEAPHTSASHSVWTVAFMAYGVAYTMDVECASGGVDERCADDGLALGVYESLVRLEGVR